MRNVCKKMVIISKENLPRIENVVVERYHVPKLTDMDSKEILSACSSNPELSKSFEADKAFNDFKANPYLIRRVADNLHLHRKIEHLKLYLDGLKDGAEDEAKGDHWLNFEDYGISTSGGIFWRQHFEFNHTVSREALFKQLYSYFDDQFKNRKGARKLDEEEKGYLNRVFNNYGGVDRSTWNLIDFDKFGAFWEWFDSLCTAISQAPEIWNCKQRILYFMHGAKSKEQANALGKVLKEPGYWILLPSESTPGSINLTYRIEAMPGKNPFRAIRIDMLDSSLVTCKLENEIYSAPTVAGLISSLQNDLIIEKNPTGRSTDDVLKDLQGV